MFSRPEGIENTRIWVDGCFDFTHHGHAGAMLQARQLGRELYVGVHSDEDILQNKGPVVMKLAERLTAVEGCKWATKAIPDAPYVTAPDFMDKYGCKYVVHGDDITTDANGNDCYQEMKDLDRFVVVKRTPNISTTDLVGRMLLSTKTHHLPAIKSMGHGLFSNENVAQFEKYATDQGGLHPHAGVYVHLDDDPLHVLVQPAQEVNQTYQKLVYVDGGFDLFHPGHIEALRLVKQHANHVGAAVMVGIHDDKCVNDHKGLNYPIMTLFERSLCVLQCKYVDGVVLAAPYNADRQFLDRLPGSVVAVMHGPTPVDPEVYADARTDGIYQQMGSHKFDDINTQFIVKRVLDNMEAFEERQRKKGWKAENERRLEELERQKHT
ncbi:Nucleotidylyl transferase [Yamadazyma tenuis ATCC 10573]|uniref:ethanolamine-phosphate cytidylyltransferase n=1 Tax=Candida tenuis (strain ATCC 10573 / BCRC 21748 / CBS 615 / JCM 9827 / NBRC 10315 / NRRL Y-1498 / VKM Y-70) TaxID=590646 RepID=G3BF63_CANTC|nr:Nucleotidylyl transferase [Yamadazyma tenuis ATCC 10573]EGV60649.1 Nucleotidylyl transferase [Yamadazyma tenuis ATCC 10573]